MNDEYLAHKLKEIKHDSILKYKSDLLSWIDRYSNKFIDYLKSGKRGYLAEKSKNSSEIFYSQLNLYMNQKTKEIKKVYKNIWKDLQKFYPSELNENIVSKLLVKNYGSAEKALNFNNIFNKSRNKISFKERIGFLFFGVNSKEAKQKLDQIVFDEFQKTKYYEYKINLHYNIEKELIENGEL